MTALRHVSCIFPLRDDTKRCFRVISSNPVSVFQIRALLLKASQTTSFFFYTCKVILIFIKEKIHLLIQCKYLIVCHCVLFKHGRGRS